jgi:hypothetical protein
MNVALRFSCPVLLSSAMLLMSMANINLSCAESSKILSILKAKSCGIRSFVRRCEQRGCKLQRIRSKYFEKAKMYEPHQNSINCFFSGAIAFLNDSVVWFSDAFEDSNTLSQLNNLIKTSNRQNGLNKDVFGLVREICALSERYTFVAKNDLSSQDEFYLKGSGGLVEVNYRDIAQFGDSTLFVVRQIDRSLDEMLAEKASAHTKPERHIITVLSISFQDGYPQLSFN